MVRVLRMKAGDRLILMDGEGRRYEAVIRSMVPKGVTVAVEKVLASARAFSRGDHPLPGRSQGTSHG